MATLRYAVGRVCLGVLDTLTSLGVLDTLTSLGEAECFITPV